MDDVSGTTEQVTVEDVATDFEGLLSDEPEYQDTNESQPDPKSPDPVSESGEEEGSSEQPQPVEDEAAQTEETEETTGESPTATLDPNLKVKVKIDGEDQEITLSEALKGYSREEVFTRRMQEVAAQRKEVETFNQQLRGERALYAEQLQQLEQVFEQQTPKEPDWAQVQQDTPEAFPTMWANWQQYNQRMAAIRQEREQAQEVVRRDQAVQMREQLQAEQARVLELIPEWKDATKAKAEKTKIATYAQDVLGFKPEEIAELRDSRGLIAIRKAMMWDALQAKKPAITQRIETVRAATPGSAGNRPPVSKAKAAFARLEKSGSVEDFAAGLVASGELDD